MAGRDNHRLIKAQPQHARLLRTRRHFTSPAMTWIVGGIGPSYAYVVADLRVFDREKPIEEFGVQKVLRLTERAVIALAGNVSIGLEIVESTWRQLARPIDPDQIKTLPLQALMFPLVGAIEREYEKRFSEAERALGCELLVLALVEDTGEFGWSPKAFQFRCPLPGEFPKVEYAQFAEPTNLTIGFGAEIDEYADALGQIPSASVWEEKLGRNPSAEELVDIPLYAERLLQNVVTRGQRDHNQVGPILVSTLISAEGLRWATWNTERPFIVAGRQALDLALQARARNVVIRSEKDLISLRAESEFNPLTAETINLPSFGRPELGKRKLLIPENLRRDEIDNGVLAMTDEGTIVLTFWAEDERPGDKTATSRIRLNVRAARDVIRILQDRLIANDRAPE